MAEEDIIFGKNRHFFGGIEPSNMIAFSVAVEDGVVKITADPPVDTIIDGQTLVSVAGAEIRRKTDEYPRDEFDGELIAKITASSIFVDSTADPTLTYYYAAFPYSTQGVYNTSGSSKISLNGPDPMVEFSATSAASKVTIVATLPDTVVGAVIRKSPDRYPVDETDGEAFMTITESGTYVDADVVADTTYYYSAFPYTASGAYNRDNVASNRLSILVTVCEYIFGYDLDTNDSDPSTRVTYPSDVDNANYTAAYMDYSAGTFNYGSWNIAPGEKFMPRPCVLAYAGTVSYYLNPDDYTKMESGGSSGVSSTELAGNAMMEWPKIYTKRWEDDAGIYHFRCSDQKVDDDWDCWCNYDKNDNEIDHFYTAIYAATVSNGTIMKSISYGASATMTATSEITYAKANGDDWYTEVLADRLLINDLLVMMAKSTDGQTAYGNGRCSGNSAGIDNGTMNTKGLFWGTNSNWTSGVKVFGMENYWGNRWRRIAGWMNVRGTQKVKLTRGTHDGSTATDYNLDGSGYLTVSDATPVGTSGGYINDMKTEAYGRIPVTAGGTSSTYEADSLYFNNGQSNYAMVGGDYSYSVRCGPFAVFLHVPASASHNSYCAALSCKPSAT